MENIKNNSAQEEAINTINGPMIIIACPGAGKTTTLIRRIHHMTEVGINERNILMVTFTTDAARNMKEKYLNMYQTSSQVTFSTFHSFCFQILKQLGMYTKADIMDEYDMIPQIASFLELSCGLRDAFDTARLVCGEIGSVKNNYTNVDTYESTSVETEIFKKAYKRYHEILSQEGKIDFEDMMLETEKVFRSKPQVLKACQDRFTYIQCDEYQDTNPIQKTILYMLAGEKRNLCVVGDDDQSIYRFRGAEPKIMFDFRRDFPGCKTVYMSTNYRSGKAIVAAADCLIKENTTRFEKDFISFRGENGFEGSVRYKKFSSREDEVDYLVKKIQTENKSGIEYKDMAVLYRNNNLAGYVLQKLSEAKIPFKSKDRLTSKYESWEFKTLCAYLRLSMGNYNDNHMALMLRTPNKYLSTKMYKGCKYNLKDLLLASNYITEGWKRKKIEKDFEIVFRAFPPGGFSMESNPSKLMQAFQYIGIEKAVEDRARMTNTDITEAMSILDFLETDAAKYDTIKEWMSVANKDIQKVKEINSKNNEINGITVSTMHGSKGCEWNKVFVIDVTQNIIPARNSTTPEEIEEERRVLYVALTRAKDDLEILTGGKESEFMWSLTRELDRKNRRAMMGNKPVPGTTVRSPRLGLGTVLNYQAKDDDHAVIMVDFAGTTKEFYYPDSFTDGFLSLV